MSSVPLPSPAYQRRQRVHDAVRDLMAEQFTADDLEAQMRVKDVFDPGWLLNPAKVFPLAASQPFRDRAAAE